MTFQDVLAQAIDWLQRDKRVTYRALKRQFDLDDAYLNDLKDQLLFSHVGVDEDGQGLVWTGDPSVPERDDRLRGESEGRFQAALHAVIMMLQRDRRVTYRSLQHIFSTHDSLMAEIYKELTFRQLAIEVDGEGLIWTGETLPRVQPDAVVPSLENLVSTDTISLASPVPQPVHSTSEVERRQLTVMFCDLADSTTLSQQLDPEDLREVIRAYQQTSADVIQQFDGYIAQHLGDGLLIYFGWPQAHEDDAQRALLAGLGIAEAITTTLNPRLKDQKGVQLTVRLGGPYRSRCGGSDGE